MKNRVSSVSALAVLLACAGCGSSAAPEPEGSAEQPVVGGGVDTTNQFPWVGFLNTPSWGCSAELVTPNWILTANHCVTGTTNAPTTQDITGQYTVSFDPLATSGTGGAPSLRFTHSASTAGDGDSVVFVRKSGAIDSGSREDNAQDLALIRLDKAVPTGLIPLAPIAGLTAPAGAQGCTWIAENSGVAHDGVATLIGYGPTDGSFCTSGDVFCSSNSSPGRNSFHDAGWGYQSANTGDLYLTNTWSNLSYHGLAHGDSGGALFWTDKNGLSEVCGVNSGLYDNGSYASDYEAQVDSPNNNAFLRAHLLNADGSLKGTCNITSQGVIGEGSELGGPMVEIDGNGFDTAHPPVVTFGGVAAPSVTCSSTTRCLATVPAGPAGIAPVSVTMWGTATCTGNSISFQYGVGTNVVVDGMCMTAGSTSPPAHAGVHIVPCNQSDATQYTLFNTNGTIELGGYLSGMCLDVPGGSTANGTLLQAYPCNGGTNQQFTWNVNGSLSVLGKCVDLPGGNTASGTPLQIYDCNGGPNQKLDFVPIPAGQIEPLTNNTKCVDVPNASTANGTQIQLFDCNPSFPSNQVLHFEDDGSIHVLGKCLDVPGGSTTNGTLIQIYDCNGGPNQKFVHASDNSLQVLGKCLDLPSGFTVDHTNIQIYDCNGGQNQKWRLNP